MFRIEGKKKKQTGSRLQSDGNEIIKKIIKRNNFIITPRKIWGGIAKYGLNEQIISCLFLFLDTVASSVSFSDRH